MKQYLTSIINHYKENWGDRGEVQTWDKGPREELADEFTVLEFPPEADRDMWTYATACMSHPDDKSPIELHLFSPQASQAHVELLTAIAHYHRNEVRLDLEHSVNFGRPWQLDSQCDHGVISLPYLDGPDLEILEFDGKTVQFLWLIPVTTEEVEYKKKYGFDSLEQEFEKYQIDYLDPLRISVV
jgi:hypothetical protein